MASHLYTNPPQVLHFLASSSSPLKPNLYLSFKRIKLQAQTTSSSVLIRCASQSSISVTSKKWSLQGMSALVTGGTRGIGRAIVEELAGLGAEVHTCARNESELENCLRAWKSSGFRIAGSVCDVSDQAQREALMEIVSSVFDGKLHILVNNVGTNIRKPMVEFTAGEFSTLMSTNFEPVFNLCQLAYPLLRASEAGSVVSISSVSGFVSLKNMSLQSATKGAINQLTRSLACEWAKDNIRINAVAPWYIKTSMVEQVLSNKDYLEEVYSVTPLGRLGEPREWLVFWSSFLGVDFHCVLNLHSYSVCPWFITTPLTNNFLSEKDSKEKVETRPPMGLVGMANEVSLLVAFLCLPAASYIRVPEGLDPSSSRYSLWFVS